MRRLLVAVVLCVGTVVLPGTAHAANDSYVEPFDAGRFTAGLPTDPDSARVRSILANTNRYALGTWWHTAKNYDAQTGAYLTFGGTAEANIRPPASEAFALAVALSTGGYDPAVTGVSAATAAGTTARLVRSVAYRHVANTNGGWGYSWQSAYWAALAGTAGWLRWSDLSGTDREYVRKMVEFEANRFIGWPVPYWKNRAGTLLRPCGDTAAEENAWNARLLFLAHTMMPQHSRRSGWAYKANELSIGAFARPADLTSPATIRGRPFGDWLEGTNVTNDGSLVNHGFYHPDYTSTVTELISGSLVYPLGGRPVPANALAGASLQYAMLVNKQWWPAPAAPCPDSRPFRAPSADNPSGTMYIPGSDAIHYPQGNDWGTTRRAHFAELDVVVGAFDLDHLASRNAAYWEDLHAQKALDMQRRPLPGGAPSDGSTYRGSTEDTYSGREEWVAVRAAGAWLAKWLAHQGALTTTDDADQIVVDDSDRGVTVTGTWTTGSLASNGPQVFGPTVRYKPAGAGTAYLRYTPRLTQARTYQIYVRWNAAPAQATNTPFTINHATGTIEIRRDQRAAGGTWNLLGTYTMGPGDYVQITDNANGYVVADGLLLHPS